MIKLCTNPDCDTDAGVTLQRQIDPAPVPYCLQHAAETEERFRLKLENFTRVVIAAQEPTELERLQARVAELEGAGAVGAAAAKLIGSGSETELEQKLESARRTLAVQGEVLETLRKELSESRQAFDVAQRELERVKRERDRIQGDLTMATRALELARTGKVTEPTTPAAPAPATPPPPTRPDGSKP